MSTNFGLNLGAVYVANKDPLNDSIPVTFDKPISLVAGSTVSLASGSNVGLVTGSKVTLENSTVSLASGSKVSLENSTVSLATNSTIGLAPGSKVSLENSTVSLAAGSTVSLTPGSTIGVSITSGGAVLTGPSSLIAGAQLGGTFTENDEIKDVPENLTSITNKSLNSNILNYVRSLATTQITQTKNIVVLGQNDISNNYIGDTTAIPSFKPDSASNNYIINMIDGDTAVKYSRINLMGQLTAFSSNSPVNIYKPNATTTTNIGAGSQYETNIYIWYSNDKQFWFKTSLGTIRFGSGTVPSAISSAALDGGGDSLNGGTFEIIDTPPEPIQFSRDWETAAKYVALTFDTNFTGTVLCSLSQ
jgi:hypothetical protein